MLHLYYYNPWQLGLRDCSFCGVATKLLHFLHPQGLSVRLQPSCTSSLQTKCYLSLHAVETMIALWRALTNPYVVDVRDNIACSCYLRQGAVEDCCRWDSVYTCNLAVCVLSQPEHVARHSCETAHVEAAIAGCYS